MPYNTGNPVGSTDARDLADNAAVFDRMVNGGTQTVQDRLGNVRKTAKYIADKAVEVDAAVDAVEAAKTQAINVDIPAALAEMDEALLTTAPIRAESAADRAELARDAALLSRGVFETTAKALSMGVVGVASIVGGSGGTNGTFNLSFSGGGGSGAAGRFVVAGGAVVSVTITANGDSYTSAPTISFAASSGLSGASATAVIANNVDVGEYFSIPVVGSVDSLILYRVSSGPVATEVCRYASADSTKKPAWAGKINGWPDTFFRSFDLSSVVFLGRNRWRVSSGSVFGSYSRVPNPVFDGFALRRLAGAGNSPLNGPLIYLDEIGAVAGDTITIYGLFVGDGAAVSLYAFFRNASDVGVGSQMTGESSTGGSTVTVSGTPQWHRLQAIVPSGADRIWIYPVTFTANKGFDLVALWAFRGNASAGPDWPTLFDQSQFDRYQTNKRISDLELAVSSTPVGTSRLLDKAVTLQKTAFSIQSKNLFDKSTVVDNKYVSNLDGLLYDNSAYHTSDFIPVVAGSAYALSYTVGPGVRFTCYYNSSKQFLPGGANTNISGFTAPSGAEFVRITTYKGSTDSFQMELGSQPTSYVPYGFSIDPSVLPPVSELAPEIVLPPTIVGVQGRECNVYFDNLHLSTASDYFHNVTSASGTGVQQNERWTWTPSGQLLSGSLIIDVHDKRTGALLVSKTASQRAASSSAGSGTTKKVLIIGDSLINAGVIGQTLLDLAAADVMGVSLLGTRGTGANKHEGRGGWSIQDYSTVGRTYYSFAVSGVVTPPAINSTTYTNNGNTYTVQEVNLTGGNGTIVCSVLPLNAAPTASGVLTKASGVGDSTISFSSFVAVSGNPFWVGGALNFAQYLTNTGQPVPDWVLVSLGINDAFSYTSDSAVSLAADTGFAALDGLIANIKAVDSNTRVGIVIPTPPSNSQDAFGSAYGTGQTQWRDKRNILIWARQMIAKYSGQEANRVFLVPSNVALDTVNNYPRSASSPVNSRNPGVMVARQNNGVHPDTSGYQQIADAMWAFLKFYA